MFYCMCSLYVLGMLSSLFWLFLRQGLPGRNNQRLKHDAILEWHYTYS